MANSTKKMGKSDPSCLQFFQNMNKIFCLILAKSPKCVKFKVIYTLVHQIDPNYYFLTFTLYTQLNFLERWCIMLPKMCAFLTLTKMYLSKKRKILAVSVINYTCKIAYIKQNVRQKIYLNIIFFIPEPIYFVKCTIMYAKNKTIISKVFKKPSLHK